MLKLRLLTAAVLISLVLAAMFLLPPAGWRVFLLVPLAVAAHEWARLSRMTRAGEAVFIAALLACIGVLMSDAMSLAGQRAVLGLSILFWLVIVPLWLWTHRRIDNRLILAVAGLVVLVPTWLAFAVLQRAPVLLLLLMAVVWIADTAAYFFGHQFGRHKLAPRISPGKTWEGVGGALLCIAVYAAVLQYVDAVAQDEEMLVPYLLAMTLFSVEGDLLESWLKRCAGVKDSGTILPGHGGILDRIDALTSALPLAAWLFAAQ